MSSHWPTMWEQTKTHASLRVRPRIVIVTLMLLESVFGCAWVMAQTGSSQSVAATVAVGSGAPVAGTSSTFVPTASVEPEYRIALSDVLHVNVWKEPELTATVSVRRDGKISIPLLNDVQAVGLTPMELSAYLADKLRKFVEDPRVTVIVSQANPPRIYLVGEVMHHGPMTLLPDMTIFQALVTSGLTQFANTKKIYILRTVDNDQRKLFVNYKKLIKGQSMSQNIKLEPGDTIVVP